MITTLYARRHYAGLGGAEDGIQGGGKALEPWLSLLSQGLDFRCKVQGEAEERLVARVDAGIRSQLSLP